MWGSPMHGFQLVYSYCLTQNLKKCTHTSPFPLLSFAIRVSLKLSFQTGGRRVVWSLYTKCYNARKLSPNIYPLLDLQDSREVRRRLSLVSFWTLLDKGDIVIGWVIWMPKWTLTRFRSDIWWGNTPTVTVMMDLCSFYCLSTLHFYGALRIR